MPLFLTPTPMATSFWCHSCSRFIRAHPVETISCPECHGGFIEEVGGAPSTEAGAFHHHNLSSSVDESNLSAQRINSGSRPRRRASAGQGSLFNPVIVLRESAGVGDVSRTGNGGSNFGLFYDDGAGLGLRPLPQSMSDFLMGSGFDQLLDQLSRVENSVGGVRSCENNPASKTAVESLPTISINDSHIGIDSQCAVCMETFELGGQVQEMPCKHIFHEVCIQPWLSLRNSCPVCRHELPTDLGRTGEDVAGQTVLSSSSDSSSGLTIWRLSSGGFAVGRFSGSRRNEDREFPMIYTNLNGNLGSGDIPTRIVWPSRGNRSADHRGIGRLVHNLFSMFRCFNSSSSALSSSRINLSSTSDGSQI